MHKPDAGPLEKSICRDLSNSNLSGAISNNFTMLTALQYLYVSVWLIFSWKEAYLVDCFNSSFRAYTKILIETLTTVHFSSYNQSIGLLWVLPIMIGSALSSTIFLYLLNTIQYE